MKYLLDVFQCFFPLSDKIDNAFVNTIFDRNWSKFWLECSSLWLKRKIDVERVVNQSRPFNTNYYVISCNFSRFKSYQWFGQPPNDAIRRLQSNEASTQTFNIFQHKIFAMIKKSCEISIMDMKGAENFIIF